MSRQHTTPFLLGVEPTDSIALTALSLAPNDDNRIDEAYIRDLIFAHPTVLPIGEIDREFIGAVPICTELATPAGYLDVLLLTPTGLPIIVECKLWRNPEARREVVGQILDYAKELSRFSASDLRSAASSRLKRGGNVLLDLVRTADPLVDEADFNDALTRNLRRGRFLLLIVGDGIREGTEAIAEYLQLHSGLHFTLGLVELPVFQSADGRRLVTPRVLLHTKVIEHTVVSVPEGFSVESRSGAQVDDSMEADSTALDRLAFWTDFLTGLDLNDPEQPRPKPNTQGNLSFMMPVKGGSCWLTVYRNSGRNMTGIFLSYSRSSPGEKAVLRVLEDIDDFKQDVHTPVEITVAKDGRSLLTARAQFGSFTIPDERSAAIAWLQARTNEFVTVLRPRIRAAVADAADGSS